MGDIVNNKNISVIMSVYNEKEIWLREAIESILNQTWTNLEFIIIVDNPKNNNIINLLNEYAKRDSRIKINVNKENLGLVKSLNKALKLCNGDFIARMDADDFSDSKRFEEQIKFLNENPDISLCATGVTIMNEDGCDLYKAKIYGTTPKKAEKSLIYRNVFPHGSWMFRREILDKIYGYREIPQAEDYELLFRMLDMGEKIAVLPKYLFKYRLRTNGISFKSLYNQKKMMIEIKNKYIQCKNDKKEFIFNLQKDINTSEEEIEKYLKYQNIYTESISQIRTKKRFIEFKNIIKVFIKCRYKREELKAIIALKLINK